jgi:hypothetical protein
MTIQYHVIENSIDIDYLRSLKTLMFSEKRLNGNDMRDIGNRLEILINRIVLVTDEVTL